MNMITENITWIAAGGLLATCWRQLMAMANRFRSFFIIHTTVRGNAVRAVHSYLLKHYKRSPFSDCFVQSAAKHVRPIGRVQEVAWELPPIQPIIFYKGKNIIMFGGMNANNNSNTTVPDYGLGTLITLRGSVDVEKLIVDALKEFNLAKGDTGQRRFAIRRIQGVMAIRNGRGGKEGASPTGWGYPHTEQEEASEGVNKFYGWNPEDIGAPTQENPMAHLSLPTPVKPLIQEFRQWKDSEKWFKSKLIPWRRGWLLHGKPGTGKTSLVRALGQMFDMPIYSYDLATLSNDELVREWTQMQESTPCIALFEDIDSTFNGRDNILEIGGGLTFDCLLNCIGGVQSCDGVFTVGTTNCIEKIDSALGIQEEKSGMSSRPGRFDRVVEMPNLGPENLKEIAQRILGEWPEEMETAIAMGKDFTGAQFTELCAQRALTLYWKQKNHRSFKPQPIADATSRP